MYRPLGRTSITEARISCTRALDISRKRHAGSVSGEDRPIYRSGIDRDTDLAALARGASIERMDCLLCSGADADAQLNRTLVWEDRLWRLSMSRRGYTTGFGYLEPKRHVSHITDLDGQEAATFGAVIARVSSAMKEAAHADLVYVYIFGGGIPHLHVHLGPHREGDALNANIIRGEVVMEPQPSGAGRVVSHDFPELPAVEIAEVVERTRELLSGARNIGLPDP